ncbi:MAG TPA: general secretion pathway protein GspB [Lysobacter sp.]|jgi:general secretion pathway protein B|nr:general secretion pathway protein GspB [Lysobacter sp.]
MSLILEALRKSEAERRRGQAPDLLSEATPVALPSHTTMSRSWPWLLATAAALVVVLLALFWRSRDALTPASANSAIAASPAVVADKDRRTPAGVAHAAAIPAHAAVMPTRATTAPTTPSKTRTAPASPAIVAPATASSEAGIAPPTATAASASTARPVIAPPASTPAIAPEPAPTPTAPSFASPAAPLRLADLPSEERQQLPALKVSMHMWAPDAAQRFAIIDGNRVGEGDRVGDATIEAISQDGVMLAWRGRRIRLPIR